MFSIPQPILEKHKALERLVNTYPDYIPIADLAKFLNTNPEGLKAWIESGRCPFAFAWNREIPTINTRGKAVGMHLGRTAYKVPTYTFYMWYTNNAIFYYLNKFNDNNKMGAGS